MGWKFWSKNSSVKNIKPSELLISVPEMPKHSETLSVVVNEPMVVQPVTKITVEEHEKYISITTPDGGFMMMKELLNQFDTIQCSLRYVTMSKLSDKRFSSSFGCSSNEIALEVYHAIVKYKFKKET